MTTPHTPGPWRVADIKRSKEPGSMAMVATPGGRQCIDCTMSGASPGADNANARLVAAAPDLLDAVQIWMRFFDTMPKGQFARISCDIGLMNDGFIKSRAAITKAVAP